MRSVGKVEVECIKCEIELYSSGSRGQSPVQVKGVNKSLRIAYYPWFFPRIETWVTTSSSRTRRSKSLLLIRIRIR